MHCLHWLVIIIRTSAQKNPKANPMFSQRHSIIFAFAVGSLVGLFIEQIAGELCIAMKQGLKDKVFYVFSGL